MRALLFSFVLLTACAVVDKKGILVDVEPGTPMDESDLRQHCDLGDNAACVLAGLHDAQLPEPHFSLIQGVAPADRAAFAALIPKGETISWFIYDRALSRLTKLFTAKPVSRGDSKWAVQRIDVRGLEVGRTFELLAGDTNGRLIDLRRFRPLDLDDKNLHIGILGGWRFASAEDRANLLARALSPKPQLVVFSGSTADAKLPSKLATEKGKPIANFYFGRYTDARATLELGFARDMIPVAILWNDDEFGKADGDRSFPQRDSAREQLELLFPTWADETSIVSGPGISKAITFRRQNLALVDDLSYRAAPHASEQVCVQRKKSKKEVCTPGKPVPAPPGSRYGGILRDWVAFQASRSEHPFWILAGGPNLYSYSLGWTNDPSLNSPTLSAPPGAAWEASVETSKDGSLRLEGAELIRKAK